MRHLIYTCAVALAIGCTTQPSHSAEPANTPAQPAPATAATPADATPAESATPAATTATAQPTAPTQAADEQDTDRPEFQRAAKAYRQMEKDGQKLYCRNEKRLGTRLPSPVCLTEAQLWERIRKAESVRDEMRSTVGAPCPPDKNC